MMDWVFTVASIGNVNYVFTERLRNFQIAVQRFLWSGFLLCSTVCRHVAGVMSHGVSDAVVFWRSLQNFFRNLNFFWEERWTWSEECSV